MKFLKAIWMWFLVLLMFAVLTPAIYLDAWLEKRERRKRWQP